MKILKHVGPISLAAVFVMSSAIPAFAAETVASSPSEKEEVIYITLHLFETVPLKTIF